MITMSGFAVELSSEKGRHRFLYAEINLAQPGELFRNSSYEFAFDAKKPHESYSGTSVHLRYVHLWRVGHILDAFMYHMRTTQKNVRPQGQFTVTLRGASWCISCPHETVRVVWTGVYGAFSVRLSRPWWAALRTPLFITVLRTTTQ